jgi:AcrR family transcriptional regulator
MMAAGVDARIARTRAALTGALLALAGEKDFAEITIGEIAERAEVGYATFFRHFRSKEALLADAADALIDELLGVMLPALLQDDTRAAAISLCRFVDARRSICRSLLAGGAEANIRRDVVARAEARAVALDMPRPPGLPKEVLIGHSVTATVGLLAWWLDRGEGLTPEAMGEVIDRLVLRPVRSG